MSVILGHQGGPIRVAIADDSGLIYSDDYRHGWVQGFKALGCEVQVFDISIVRKIGGLRSPYSAGSARGMPKMVAQGIKSWRPNLVFVHHGRAATNETFLGVLNRNRIKTAVYLCDEPYETGETARYSTKFDYVFTMDPCTMEAHAKARNNSAQVFYLPPGVDTNAFTYRPYSERTGPEAFFLGNAKLHPRPAWLKPIDQTIEGSKICYWDTVGKGHKDWIPIEDYPKLYANCLIGLNVHRDPGITKKCWQKRVYARPSFMDIPKGMKLVEAPPTYEGTGFWNDANLPASHINPRFLEMAASGTLVVNDNHRSELRRMFPMAPQAESPEHFLELVNYYLDHLAEAEIIGQACSYLISKRHTYRHRAAEVLIRVGLKDAQSADLRSCLGAPEDWLSPQELGEPAVRSSLDQTGPSERWSPAYGMSLTQTSGSPSEATSLDAPTPWLA